MPEFAGHGVGREFHTPPFIFHFRNGEPGVMQPGMIFTIGAPMFHARPMRSHPLLHLEPVLCEGPPEFELWRDNWTAVSLSGGWSAQFEHTLLVTPTGVDVLTL